MSFRCSRCRRPRINSYSIGTTVELCRECFKELRDRPTGKTEKHSLWSRVLGVFG